MFMSHDRSFMTEAFVLKQGIRVTIYHPGGKVLR